MADKILGMPRNYAIIGGVAVAGIVAYAWYSNADTAVIDPATEPIEASADEYESPLGNSGGNSTGSFPGTVGEDAIRTNAQWTQAAVEYLASTGYDSGAVANALGKYLAFKALSANEAQIVMAARAGVGDPPTGGPYPIKDALPDTSTPAPTTMKAPSGLTAKSTTRDWVQLDWTPVSGVKGYVIYRNGVRIESVVYSESGVPGLKPNTSYKFTVRGLYPGDKIGPPSSTITVKTKK